MPTKELSIVVGGAGFVGSVVTRQLAAAGAPVLVVDRRAPVSDPPVEWIAADLLTDDLTLPPGRVLMLAGCSDPRPRRPWTLFRDIALSTARLLPALAGRDVTLLSSIEIYGRATAPLTASTTPALPVDDDTISEWCERAIRLADDPCPPWRTAALCRKLDAGPRWTYAVAKRAQELLLMRSVPVERLTILRAANVFGLGQERVVTRLVRRAVAGQPLVVTDNPRSFVSVERLASEIISNTHAGALNISDGTLQLADVAAVIRDALEADVEIEVQPAPADDSCGVVVATNDQPAVDLREQIRRFARVFAASSQPLFDPPLPVVVPPRPENPDAVAARQQDALWSGAVKHGNRWTSALSERLASVLELTDEQALLLTASGTTAVRLAVLSAVGGVQPGAVAVVPSFTFAATIEVLTQLGFRLRFCDVDPATWTIDAEQVRAALAPGDVSVVVAVDALGNPADYARLAATCRAAGVPLVADSAPSVGARYDGTPVGTQAVAHAFSFSFAKVVSAGGAGGAVVVRRENLDKLRGPANWLRSELMGELPAIAALDLVDNLDDLVARRQEVAAIYGAFAAARAGQLAPQFVRPGDTHAWVHWVARIADGQRPLVAARLADLGVCTKPYYAPALHMEYAAPVTLPVTESLVADALALPMSSELTPGDAERMVMALDAVLGELAGDQRRTAAYRDRPRPDIARVTAPVAAP